MKDVKVLQMEHTKVNRQLRIWKQLLIYNSDGYLESSVWHIVSVGTHTSNFSHKELIPAVKNCAVLTVLYWKKKIMMKFHILLYFNATSHGTLQSFKRSTHAASQLSLRAAAVSPCPVMHRALRDVCENRLSVNVTHPESVEMHH
jgi:hypothetical protein